MTGVDIKCARRMAKHTNRAATVVTKRQGLEASETSILLEMVPRFVSRLPDVSDGKRKRILKLCHVVYKSLQESIKNHRPETIAAGLVHAVCGIMDCSAECIDSVSLACVVSSNTMKSVSSKISKHFAETS